MGIDPRRLGESAQRQILTKVAKVAKQKEPKMHNRSMTLTLEDGTKHKFDSIKEANRYKELVFLQQAGKIAGLKIQQRYELIPKQQKDDGTWERACSYIADFDYWAVERVAPEADEKDIKRLYTWIPVDDYKHSDLWRKAILQGEEGFCCGLHYGTSHGKWIAWKITHVVEDVKGYRCPSQAVYQIYVIKRKLMLEKYGITVKEI